MYHGLLVLPVILCISLHCCRRVHTKEYAATAPVTPVASSVVASDSTKDVARSTKLHEPLSDTTVRFYSELNRTSKPMHYFTGSTFNADLLRQTHFDKFAY
jgi:hypothetical protein